MPWSDFTLKNKGCSSTIDEVRVDEDAKSLKNDRITIQAISKYHPTLKAIKHINTTNNLSIQVNQQGFWGHERHKYVTVFQGRNGQHAGRGDNLTIKVKTVTHKQTGVKLNKIDIYNTTKNKHVARYKLTTGTKLIINNQGGGGMNGYEGRDSSPNGGNGGSGGAGGNILLIKDPSVTKLNISLNNQGGNGGKGGAPKYSHASRGRSGVRGDNGRCNKTSKINKIKFLKINYKSKVIMRKQLLLTCALSAALFLGNTTEANAQFGKLLKKVTSKKSSKKTLKII